LRRTCDGEVRLLILDDRILDDLFKLGSEITCERDRISDVEGAQAGGGSRSGGINGILVDDSQVLWNRSAEECGRGRRRFAYADEGFALERNQVGDEGATEGVQATWGRGEGERVESFGWTDQRR